jgi:hypothetical protein
MVGLLVAMEAFLAPRPAGVFVYKNSTNFAAAHPVEDDEEEGPGVEIDAGVESDGGGRLEEAHGRPPIKGYAKGGGESPPPSSQARAFMSIHWLQQTGRAIGDSSLVGVGAA